MAKRLDKQARKTLRGSAGPICTPPNRPCGDRCIPPNWECHTGINGPLRAGTAYQARPLQAAGDLEAAGRELLALARPGNRRNVAKSINRATNNLTKAAVQLVSYPELKPREKAGKSEAEIQALEAQRYAQKVNRVFGLAFGSALFLGTTGFAFSRRRQISQAFRTYAARGSTLKDLVETGAEWGPRTPYKGSTFIKQLESLLFGRNSLTEATKDQLKNQATKSGLRGASTIPYFAQGPGTGYTELIPTLRKTGALPKVVQQASGVGPETMLLKKYREALGKAADIPSGRLNKGQGGLSAEDVAFRDAYRIMIGGGGPDEELDKAITRNLYTKYLDLPEVGNNQSVRTLLADRYSQELRGIKTQVRTGMVSKLGMDANLREDEAWRRYARLPQLDRLALFMDDSLPQTERLARATVYKEWADSFQIRSPNTLANEDYERTATAVGILRKQFVDGLKTPKSPLYDTQSIEYIFGNSDLNLPDIRLADERRLAALPRPAGMSQQEYEAALQNRRLIAGARAAMRNELNRVRFQQGKDLSLLTNEDLLQVMKDTGISTPVPLTSLSSRPSQAEILRQIRQWQAQNPDRNLVLNIDGTEVVYKKRRGASETPKTDSAFNWGSDWQRYQRPDWGSDWQRYQTDAPDEGKPCGKSFIPRNHKCRAGAGTQPQTQQPRPPVDAKAVAMTSAALGSTLLLASLGVKQAQIARYRKNVSQSAIKAEGLAKEMMDEFRQNASTRLNKPLHEVNGFEASTYNFKDKGFDRGFGSDDNTPDFFGQTPDSRGAVVMLSYADDNKFTRRGQGSYKMAKGGAFQEIWGEHDVLPYANNISQPTSRSLDDLAQREQEEFIKRSGKLAPLAKRYVFGKQVFERFGYLRKNIDRGFNPDAVRVAGFVAAQRRLTGKPVHIMSYSNGGNVASEALAILNEMGYRDVRVVNVAGPTFGIFKHNRDQMRTWVSPGDEFWKFGGGRNAFQGSEVSMLKNPNIPHGLQDKIDPNSREHGKDAKRHFKEGNSYLLDKQMQREAYTFLTVDKVRSQELADEYIWRVAENKPMEGALGDLIGNDKQMSGEFLSRYRRNKQDATNWLRDNLEERMIDKWYGGYNPKEVKRRQKQIRKTLEQQTRPQNNPEAEGAA